MVSLPEGSSLSDRKRNQSLYQPFVWDQLPLPVSIALGDLKSFSKREAVDDDRYVIKYKHTLVKISTEVDRDSLHAHMQHTQLYLADWTWQAAPLLSVSFLRGWGVKDLHKVPKAQRSGTSSGSHWPEESFINTWPGWTGCPCKKRKGDLVCVSRAYETSNWLKQTSQVYSTIIAQAVFSPFVLLSFTR